MIHLSLAYIWNVTNEKRAKKGRRARGVRSTEKSVTVISHAMLVCAGIWLMNVSLQMSGSCDSSEQTEIASPITLSEWHGIAE